MRRLLGSSGQASCCDGCGYRITGTDKVENKVNLDFFEGNYRVEASDYRAARRNEIFRIVPNAISGNRNFCDQGPVQQVAEIN